MERAGPLAQARAMSNECWYAWAAGIIDGEGCIRLARMKRKNRPNDTWTIQVYVANTDIRMLIKLRDLFGGTIANRKVVSPKHKQQWRWQVFSKKAVAVLTTIKPWLIAKRDQSDVVLSSQLYRRKGKVRANIPALESIAQQTSDLKRQKFIYATH